MEKEQRSKLQKATQEASELQAAGCATRIGLPGNGAHDAPGGIHFP